MARYSQGVTMVMLGISLEELDPIRQRQALIDAAQAGDARVQSRLGDVYRIGDELTAQDFVEALKWYRLAAEQGNACAQNDVGSMYLNGFGITKDATEAARWYRKPAEQGVAVAQFNLALRYLHGDGLDEDEHEAVRWLIK